MEYNLHAHIQFTLSTYRQFWKPISEISVVEHVYIRILWSRTLGESCVRF